MVETVKSQTVSSLMRVRVVREDDVERMEEERRRRQEQEREEQHEARVHRGGIAGLEGDGVAEAGKGEAPQRRDRDECQDADRARLESDTEDAAMG